MKLPPIAHLELSFGEASCDVDILRDIRAKANDEQLSVLDEKRRLISFARQ